MTGRDEVHVSRFGGRRRAGEEDYFFVGDAGCAVSYGGAEVFCSEVRIVLEEAGFEMAQDVADFVGGELHQLFWTSFAVTRTKTEAAVVIRIGTAS